MGFIYLFIFVFFNLSFQFSTDSSTLIMNIYSPGVFYEYS